MDNALHSPAITVRRPSESDAALIALLGTVTFTETFGHLFSVKEDLQTYLAETFGTAKIHASLEKPQNAYWLASVDEVPAGYAKLKLHSPSPFIPTKNICQLQKIYVLGHFHSLRIGRALQEEVMQNANLRGFERIWLSVLKSNDKAIRFYRKNGFAEVGEYHFTIGREDFTFMVMDKGLH